MALSTPKVSNSGNRSLHARSSPVRNDCLVPRSTFDGNSGVLSQCFGECSPRLRQHRHRRQAQPSGRRPRLGRPLRCLVPTRRRHRHRRTFSHLPAPEERSVVHVATRLRSALIDIACAARRRNAEPDPAVITELQTRYVEAIGHARGTAGPDPDNTLTWSWAHQPPAQCALWKNHRHRGRAVPPRPARPPQSMRRLPLPLSRRQQEQQPPVVLDGRLRQDRQDAPVRRATRCTQSPQRRVARPAGSNDE